MSDTQFSNGFNVLDNLKHLTAEEVKAIAMSDRLPYAVCMLNLEHDLNIGNCIRTAHLMGAEQVFTIGNNKVDHRACVGSQNYTNITKRKIAPDENLIDVFFQIMGGNGYRPIFIEKTHTSRALDFSNLDEKMSPVKYCLVFGNEQSGIPNELLQIGAPIMHIDQLGVIRSLNVASAAAIACYEMKKFLEN